MQSRNSTYTLQADPTKKLLEIVLQTLAERYNLLKIFTNAAVLDL